MLNDKYSIYLLLIIILHRSGQEIFYIDLNIEKELSLIDFGRNNIHKCVSLGNNTDYFEPLVPLSSHYPTFRSMICEC